ncbi:hypothetical protein OF83DRAFT_1153553 [Amylostereum chailletii]|nr:hypothetical protein OF83DRAFT_1153553 [Amylostereum chailletii]
MSMQMRSPSYRRQQPSPPPPSPPSPAHRSSSPLPSIIYLRDFGHIRDPGPKSHRPRSPVAHDKVKRPLNPFMLYRMDTVKTLKRKDEAAGRSGKQTDYSRTVAKMWGDEPGVVKDRYTSLAAKVKAEHERLFPEYKYTPQRKIRKEKMSGGGPMAGLSPHHESLSHSALLYEGSEKRYPDWSHSRSPHSSIKQPPQKQGFNESLPVVMHEADGDDFMEKYMTFSNY